MEDNITICATQGKTIEVLVNDDKRKLALDRVYFDTIIDTELLTIGLKRGKDILTLTFRVSELKELLEIE